MFLSYFFEPTNRGRPGREVSKSVYNRVRARETYCNYALGRGLARLSREELTRNFEAPRQTNASVSRCVRESVALHRVALPGGGVMHRRPSVAAFLLAAVLTVSPACCFRALGTLQNGGNAYDHRLESLLGRRGCE